MLYALPGFAGLQDFAAAAGQAATSRQESANWLAHPLFNTGSAWAGRAVRLCLGRAAVLRAALSTPMVLTVLSTHSTDS